MVGTFSVVALMLNVAVGVAVAMLIVGLVRRALAMNKSPRYYVSTPKEGGRGRWWVGINNMAGIRVFQSAPPGFVSKQEAIMAAQTLIDGGLRWLEEPHHPHL